MNRLESGQRSCRKGKGGGIVASKESLMSDNERLESENLKLRAALTAMYKAHELVREFLDKEGIELGIERELDKTK